MFKDEDKFPIPVAHNGFRTRIEIENYFNKISNDTKHDLACEIVIELGDMVYWDDKSLEYKYEMTKVFEKQLDDLKEIVPDFYVANATIHFDEHSPRLHIIGVPVKENCKTGLSRQVGKTSISTKESLMDILAEVHLQHLLFLLLLILPCLNYSFQFF